MGVRRSALLLGLVLLLLPSLASAQRIGPVFLIHGRPDPVADPPYVHVRMSIIDPEAAQAIGGLSADDFSLREAHADVASFEVLPEDMGMAVMFVIDRGGISAPGDRRIQEATELVRDFVNRLTIAGTAHDDVMAIVGIGDNGVLGPEENFSYDPVDKNLVLNTLVVMEAEAVRGGTPLYEGLDEALNLLTKNPDSTIRQVLALRRKVIVVFSDGLDPNFSDEAREQDIIRKAVAAGIPIYAVGMARGTLQLTGEANLRKLAVQTDGLYQLHNQALHADTLSLFGRVVTQRQQYVLTYQTRQPKGSYPLDIAVETATGAADSTVEFASVLELPQLSLKPLSPAGAEFTIPYSDTLKTESPLTLTLGISVASVDGVERTPEWVRYLANGDQIGESRAEAEYSLDWPVGDRNMPGAAAIVEDFVIRAEAYDPYLQRTYTSDTPIRVRVVLDARPAEPNPEVPVQAETNAWLVPLVLALSSGLLLLAFVLLRLRREFVRRASTGGTGALKAITRQLGVAATRSSSGRLVIQKGSNVGREFSLGAPVTKVGRDPQFCDFALYDEFISNPHFTIHLEGTQFYVTDEASTNGTRLNGVVLQPYQRIPLPPEALIELGETRLQFKMGSSAIGRPGDVAPSAAEPAAQREGSAPPEWYDENPYRTQPVPRYTLPRRPAQPASEATDRVVAGQPTDDRQSTAVASEEGKSQDSDQPAAQRLDGS